MVPPMFTRIPSGKILNEMMNLIEKKKKCLSSYIRLSLCRDEQKKKTC